MDYPTRTGLAPQTCSQCKGPIELGKRDRCEATGALHRWSIMTALEWRKRPASLASRCECGGWGDIENGGISYDFGMGSRHSCYYETGVYSDGTEVQYGLTPSVPVSEDQNPTGSPPNLHIGDGFDEHDDEVSP